MKKTLTILLFAVLIMVLLPAAALADSFDNTTGAMVIDTAPSTDLQTSVEALTSAANVTSLTITSAVNYTLSYADQDFISNSLNLLISLDIADTVSFDANGDGTLGDVMNNFFDSHSTIQSVSLASATTFGIFSFYRCTSLSSIDLPSAATFGNLAFSGCTSLPSIYLPSAATFASGAFYNCDSLSSVNLPSATTFADEAFRGCDSLSNVSLASATTFGDDVFVNCPLAIELTLGSTVPTVDSSTFGYSFPAGTTIRVPDTAYNAYDSDSQDTVGTAGDDTWFGCTLEVLADSYDGSGGIIINIAPSTNLQTSVNAALAAEGSGHTVANITSLTITFNVIYTLSNADQTYMSNSLANLQTLDIADTVSFDADGNGTLGDVMEDFFNGHSTIQSVSLASATAFGNDVFTDCTALSSVSLPSADTFGDMAFSGCSSLPSVDLPSAATFGAGAFYNCDSLSSVNLPSATTFGDDVFTDCTALSSVSLPSATTFGDTAFNDCTSLSSVSLPSATTFGDGAFTGCPLAIELTLGSTVPTVGSSTFGYSFPAGAQLIVTADTYATYDNDPQDTAGASGDGMWFGWALEVLADSYDGSGGVIIKNAPPTSLQASINAALAAEGSGHTVANITSLTITSAHAVTYTLSGADQNYMSTSLSNLQTLDIADTVFFDANGNGTLGDVMDSFFNGHSTIQSVSLASATAFGNDAFGNCNKLSKVSLASATTFGDMAFWNCTSLASVSLPSATTFGNLSFNGCTSLPSIYLPSAATFASGAFYNCDSLTSVSLPSATTFGDDVFSHCNKLSSVSLPSATTFGNYAFTDCPLAIELTLGSTVPTVDSSTFGYSFPAGATVRVPDTAYNAYDSDSQDTAGTAGDDTWFGWALEVLADSYDGSGGIIINIAPSTDLQTSVNAALAAEGSGHTVANITSLTITFNVIYTLSNADQTYMSNSLANLQTLDIADFVSFDADGNGTLGDVMEDFFNGHSTIQSVSLASATAFGDDVFTDCTKLSSVSLPSAATFGDNVFRNCPLAIELTLGSTVPTVGSSTFGYSFPAGAQLIVTVDTYATYDNDPQDTAGASGDGMWFGWALLGDSYDGSGGVIIKTTPSTSLQASVNTALAAEGSGHTVANITSLTITSTVNYTLSYADQNYLSGSLTNLQTLDIADTVFFDADGNGTLGDVMSIFLMGCHSLTSVSLASATTFGDDVFMYCTALSSVSLASATTFGNDAFEGCDSLSSVSLPSSTTFGNRAFLNCDSLSSINLPSAATFGNDAFADCDSLSDVSLFSGATFGDSAFAQCTSLSSISLPSATTFGDYAFFNCDHLTSIYLPSVAAFGDSAFLNCTLLSSINLPSAATFENWAFNDCTSLSSIYLPSATTFGDGAFGGCTSLPSISLPSAAAFGDAAFWGCNTLSSVSLPSATIFGDNVFSGCPLAIELTLGSTVPTVGSSAFSNYSFPAGATVRVPDTAYNAYDSNPQDTAGTAGDDMWFAWAMESYQIQTTNPQTGDSQSSYLWLLMLVPVGFVSAVFIRKRRLSR